MLHPVLIKTIWCYDGEDLQVIGDLSDNALSYTVEMIDAGARRTTLVWPVECLTTFAREYCY